jgi:hypothetical protein
MVEHTRQPDLTTVLLVPLAITLVVLVLLHILIAFLLPLRWHRIRNEFHHELEDRLQTALAATFVNIPQDRAAALLKERQEAQKLIDEVRQVAAWLDQRQQAANIAGLYGSP